MDKTHFKEIKRLLKLRAKAQEKFNIKEESECCNALGNEYLQIGDLDEALHMHNQELQLCEALQDSCGKAVANRKIGDVYQTMGNFELAIKHHKKHLELACDDNLELQRAHTSLGQTYLEHAKLLVDVDKVCSYLFKSIGLLTESIQLATILKEENKVSVKEFNEMRIRSLINLGLCQHQLSVATKGEEKCSSAAKCRQHFERALYLAQKQSLEEEIYRVSYILSAVNCDNKQFNSALRNVETALKVAKKINNFDFIVESSEHCAQVHLFMENLHAAKRILKKLYHLQRDGRDSTEEKLRAVLKMSLIQNKISSANTNENELYKLHEALADLYFKLGCLLPALEHYKKQEVLLNEFSECTSKHHKDVYFSIASTLMDISEFDEAICYFMKEINVVNNLAEQAKTWLHIADCTHKKGGACEKVQECLEKALSCAERFGDERTVLKVLEQQQAIQETLKNHAALAETKKRIAALEMKLGVLVDELEDSEQMETNNCDLDLDDQAFEAELADKTEDDSDTDDAPRRRKRTNIVRKNEKGETALHRACIEGQLKRVELLLEQGHPLNPRDFADWTPLHEACNFGHEEIVSLLLNKGANVNAVGGGHEAVTPMHDAGTNGHFRIVSKLLQHGGDPNKVNGRGKTVLDVVASFYHQHKDDMDQHDKQEYKEVYAALKNAKAQPQSAQTLDNIVSQSTLGRDDLLFSYDSSDESNPSSQYREDSPVLGDTLPTLQKRTNSRSTQAPGASIYRDSIAALGGSASLSALTSARKSDSRKVPKLPSLLPEEDLCGDDWLVEDDEPPSQPSKKLRRVLVSKIADPSSAAKTGWKRKKTNILECSQRTAEIDIAFDNAEVNCTQDISIAPTPVIRPKPLLTNARVSSTERSALRLKVQVQDNIFNIAVPDKTKPVSWLSERVTSLFEKMKKLRPCLSLFTADGALLPQDDLVFDVLNDDDFVTAKVESWQILPLSQRYTTSCKTNSQPVIPKIHRACQECESSSVFDLKHCAFGVDNLRPLLTNLGQQELSRLLLPGNRLADTGAKCLSESLLQPVLFTTSLVELNLACNNITDAGIRCLSQCDSIKSITNLNLSYNPIRSGEGVTSLLRKCTKLKSLNLSTCYFADSTFITLDSIAKGLPFLVSLDISGNDIGHRGLSTWLDFLGESDIMKLNVSSMLNASNGEKFVRTLCNFLRNREAIMSSVDLSNNKLSHEDIANLRSVSHSVREVIISEFNDPRLS